MNDSFSLPVLSFLLLFILLVIVTAAYVRRRFQYWSRQGVAGPPPSFPFGNAHEFTGGRGHECDLFNIKKYGPVHGMFNGLAPVLVVTDAEVLQDILVRDFSQFSDRFARFFHRIQQQSLISRNGKRWKEQRSIMSPTFTSGKMKAMHHLIKQSVGNLMQHMDQVVGESGIAEFDNKDLFEALTLGVIARCAFATEINAHDTSEGHQFITYARKFLKFSSWRILLTFSLPEWLLRWTEFTAVPRDSLDFMIESSREILRQRRQQADSGSDGGNKRVDLMQLMMDAEMRKEDGSTDQLTDEEILGNIILVLIAGYDTTSSLLTFASYLLALHPGVQDRLRREIQPAVDGDGGEIKYETVMTLKYLDAVVNESLRMYPPAVKIQRTATADYEVKKWGIRLRKGDKIDIPIFALHHQSDYFPDPYKFDPERFMPENKDKLVPYSFIPFVTGPRNCIGARFALLEAKSALVSVLLNYELSPSEKTPKRLKLKSAIVLQPQNVLINYRKIR